jgi:hypothetical protein
VAGLIGLRWTTAPGSLLHRLLESAKRPRQFAAALCLALRIVQAPDFASAKAKRQIARLDFARGPIVPRDFAVGALASKQTAERAR